MGFGITLLLDQLDEDELLLFDDVEILLGLLSLDGLLTDEVLIELGELDSLLDDVDELSLLADDRLDADEGDDALDAELTSSALPAAAGSSGWNSQTIRPPV